MATATTTKAENGSNECPAVILKEVQRSGYSGKNMLKDPLAVVDPEAYQIMQCVCYYISL
ncbi:unnamed protein product [Gongylonema pulchrum]|uniref:Ribonucloprotein n=1 Tax=Gongylonema pulchrum TaxID=637853 RepID=A0A183EJ88_9BILA|nr:unnamed protein product [Gongylonema pulchrum]